VDELVAKVVVVFGGDTPEHEISLTSARAVLTHAELLGWNVLPIGVSRQDTWLVGGGALERLWRSARPELLPLGNSVADVMPGAGGRVSLHDGVPPLAAFAGYSHAFPVSHGRWGEDGTLQDLLSGFGLGVIGCDAAASALCFDKAMTRSALVAAGLPITRGTATNRDDFIANPDVVLAVAREACGAFPWFVKPVRGGSSIGISRVDCEQAFAGALENAFRWDNAALIEECVLHREMVFGVIGGSGDDLLVSPPGECVAVGGLYTYEEKYRLGNPRFVCPADLDCRLIKKATELAAESFRALGCSVFARVDLFLDKRTGEFFVNEVNTIPGLTEVSVFPKVMRAAGLSYGDLLSRLHDLADMDR
jgi:D-alanine-D-alanine ligase